MRKLILAFIGISFLFSSCKNDVQPKPKAFLALEYPEAKYDQVDIGCPYIFDKNMLAKVAPSRNRIPCWIQLDYENMKGSIFITYQPVKNNLDSLLTDAQKLPLQHTIKADVIEGDVYTNKLHSTYGMFYEVDGDAASQAQFYLTDSTNHFLTGSVYFQSLPNFDSIVPAAEYLKKDIRHLMESLRWSY
ncbi:gliding motility lipoprotein GldD [Christiangramia forsetii]|uniref:Gliding motility protein GldD n=2 Tax=Christiangramia forsetii TaxID=411153 RepID=A0M7C2_CHRFK|nr:gliding motility lipoprotein GldD [Christiangramia forsetii]GGG28207.1 gliding motility lipoprotein GldD [Christiangramia forsetii]CAL68517.1 gliding motility protein GldD [Christiangramia forsetii KT0803]